jgi:hypothetical protein
MAENFGNGVSRTLSANKRQFQTVVWQAGKPPLDSELNLMSQADVERLSNLIRSKIPSGWIKNPIGAERDFLCSEDWSNFFILGRQEAGSEDPPLWANVKGWIIPVTGTDVLDGVVSNRINLWAPPTTDSRIDLVFLEVWLAQIAPNPSEVNKPTASTIYKWGNTQFGGTNLPDDLEDPNIGYETTERVQVQYRIRVFGKGAALGDSVDLSTFPDGLDDPNVLAQGASSQPQAGFPWQNMRQELGDSGLWRSGDGDSTNALGTVDGYSYAIPICAVFRRNTSEFVARTNAGNPNQNGGFNRNPLSVAPTNPSDGTRIFLPVTLTSAISESATGNIQVTGLAGSGLDNPDLYNGTDPVFFYIGEEIIGVLGFSTATTPGTLNVTSRGRFGTQAVPHLAGDDIRFFVFRPDGLAADQISPKDILDMRRSVSLGEWDFHGILQHNLNKLFEGSLRTSYKQASGSDTEGPVVLEVDTLWADTSNPNGTEALDGPDGIRTVFSDSAVAEEASIILKPLVGGTNPVAVADFTAGATSWPAATFAPAGFQVGSGWSDQTVIEVNIGGGTTNSGARGTVRNTADNRIVRFLTPKEYWLSRDYITETNTKGRQTPVLLRFLEESWGDPAAGSEATSDHPGPMFPLPEYNFERPYIFLGGVVNSLLRSQTALTVISGGQNIIRFAGLDFDAAGSWCENPLDPRVSSLAGISNLLLHGSRNLFDVLTLGGEDLTGLSSELYVVLTGDTTNPGNAGVFRVIGAGTIGFTTVVAPAATDLVVVRVGESPGAFVTGVTLTAEARTQYTHSLDGNLLSDGASAVVVLTDLYSAAGGSTSPWSGLVSNPLDSQAVLDFLVQYSPSRGGMGRVPDSLDRISMVGVSSAEMVREAPTVLDPAFVGEAGVPAGEIYFDFQHVQTWNRLPSLGSWAPLAPDYGDGTFLKDQRRESEVFFDRGSKTLVIRPLQRTDVTLFRRQISSGSFFPATYSQGDFAGGPIDGGTLFANSRNYGYSVPWEFMPRFGRQDIPYHQTTGTSQTVFPGVNHLFGDSVNSGDDVFRVIGGRDSNSGVVSLFIQTGATSGRDYGEYYNMGLSAFGYQGRQYQDSNNYSSDLPHKGLRGIELPPFLGVARLYGVYDLREFSGEGAWNSDRVTLSTVAGRPKNLLKTNQTKQTLYIVKGGGQDVTGNPDDHTYVIPEDVIDIRLSGAYSAGDLFENMEFVVECVVFGFGRGFINKNNYVLARRRLPSGLDPLVVAPEAGGVSAILNLPLPFGEQVYTVLERTVYQGDPYMTRDGATKVVSDYTFRLGQIPQSSAWELSKAIQQYDSTAGFAQVPEIPNARSLEVLASLDFWTTLGTGKIGGPVWPGTFTDSGHIQDSGGAPERIPETNTQAPWQTEPRTFTEPSSEQSPRAELKILFLQATGTSSGQVIEILRGPYSVQITSDSDFSGVTPESAAEDFASYLNSLPAASAQLGIQASWAGGREVLLTSFFFGEDGAKTRVSLLPSAPNLSVTGFSISGRPQFGRVRTQANLSTPECPPMNGTTGNSSSPISLAGMTERLPLGILLQDSDFLGEDPLRDGASALRVTFGGGCLSVTEEAPLRGTQESGRIQSAGVIGMADGGILRYAPWTILDPTGTRKFRLYRGGGSLYVLDPGKEGGPLDFSAGGFPEGAEPVLKGFALAGRAFLVRNFPEEAFAGSDERSHGDEVQMVIVTAGIPGQGTGVHQGYDLRGQISPTGYGEGFLAADRYRLEGLPLMTEHNRAEVDPNIEGDLAPFPGRDPEPPGPC